MKKAALGIIAIAAAIGTPALAADMALKAPPPPQPVSTWTGCYVGGNVGGGWTNQDQDRVDQIITATGTTIAAPANYGSETDSGVVGGAQVGCDYQFANSVVIGVQGQFNWGSLSGSHALPAFPTFTMNDKTTNFDTVTARIGYAFRPGFLAYAKGGAAWVNNNDTLIGMGPPTFLSESASFTQVGFTVGGGVEWMFLPNWSVFAEYNFMGFGPYTQTFTAPPGLFPLGEHISISQNIQTVLVGLNYRLNWGLPK